MRHRSTGLRGLAQGTLIGLAVAAIAGASAGCGAQKSDDNAARKPRGAAGDWPYPNADLANTRRVGGPIDSASVAKLRRAWSVPIQASGYAATPVVADGVLYTQDLDSNVHAIDLHSGRRIWTKEYHDPNVGPNGVTVAAGRIYGATNTSAFALDSGDGHELWHTPLTRSEAEAIDMAPGYHDGTVFVSTALRSGGSIGILWALDAATGHRRWKWVQVPESLWGNRQVNAGGGLWHPPAFDGRGSLYIGIGNPLPFPGTADQPWGSSRPGPNRWNNSLVKLDERTGRFLWGRQVLPHDIYDWDLECPPILAEAGGRPVAIAGGKMGFVYAFDAQRGKLLWKRSVGIHNGHDDDNLLALHGRFERLRPPVTIYPGDWGGIQTQMASDGRTVYVPVNNLAMHYTSTTEGHQQELTEGTGEVVAIDVATGRVRWDRKLPHSDYGGATVANDVVFTATYEGVVWGLDARSGRVVWRSQLPAGNDAPVTVAGDMLITAGSLALDESQRPAIVAYRLGGSAG
jgi:outer membrane protein assembly factor BamB